MILLDTTIMIDFLRGKDKAIKIIKEFDQKELFTTEINVFELIVGAYAFKKDIEINVSKSLAFLSTLNVLPLDRKATLKSGEILGNLIREGKIIEQTDCLIAGIALSNGISEIVTGNKKHYERISGVKVISD